VIYCTVSTTCTATGTWYSYRVLYAHTDTLSVWPMYSNLPHSSLTLHCAKCIISVWCAHIHHSSFLLSAPHSALALQIAIYFFSDGWSWCGWRAWRPYSKVACAHPHMNRGMDGQIMTPTPHNVLYSRYIYIYGICEWSIATSLFHRMPTCSSLGQSALNLIPVGSRCGDGRW
jgi:hypothetical protein